MHQRGVETRLAGVKRVDESSATNQPLIVSKLKYIVSLISL